MTYGKNKGFSLKEIYQYKPSYLEFLIEFIEEFEIDVKDFENLPNPTIADPDKLPPKEGKRLRFYPPIKLELSVQEIKAYIENGGKSKEIKFNFSARTVDILRLKSIGQYVTPEYITRKRLRSEDMDILCTIEGTFYSNQKNSVFYFRFYRDKTFLQAVVGKPVFPLDLVLKWFHNENENFAKGEYKIKSKLLANYLTIGSKAAKENPDINSKISMSIADHRQKSESKYSGEIISPNEIMVDQKLYVRLWKSTE